MHSLKGPNFPSFPTFKSLFPLHHLPLSVALIPTPLQTLSSYFVEDMIANAALKVEAAIVFLSNTPCTVRPEDGTCSVTSVVWLSATLWTVGFLAPLSMRFSWQEYLSGLPRPPPGDLPDPETKPTSQCRSASLPLRHLGSPWQRLLSTFIEHIWGHFELPWWLRW